MEITHSDLQQGQLTPSMEETKTNRKSPITPPTHQQTVPFTTPSPSPSQKSPRLVPKDGEVVGIELPRQSPTASLFDLVEERHPKRERAKTPIAIAINPADSSPKGLKKIPSVPEEKFLKIRATGSEVQTEKESGCMGIYAHLPTTDYTQPDYLDYYMREMGSSDLLHKSK